MSFLILFILSGCETVPVKSELDKLFEKNFEGLKIPDPATIKNDSESKSFPYATLDQAWDAGIIVLMQQGVIVRASKENGIIVIIIGPHTVKVLMEKELAAVKVYLNWMEESGGEFTSAASFSDYIPGHVNYGQNAKKTTTENFFGKLATQIYSGEKWKYLYGGNKN